MRYSALLCTIVLVGCSDAIAPTPPSAPLAARTSLAPRNASFDSGDDEGDHGNPQGPPVHTTVPFSTFDCAFHPVTGTAEQTVFTRTFTRDGSTFAINVVFQRVHATLLIPGQAPVQYVGTDIMSTTSIVTPTTNTQTLIGDLDLFAVRDRAPDIFVDTKVVLTNGTVTSVSFSTRCPTG